MKRTALLPPWTPQLRVMQPEGATDMEALLDQVFAHPLALPAIIGLAVAGIAYAVIYPLLSGEARAEKRQGSVIKTVQKVGNTRVADAMARKKQVAEAIKEMDARAAGKSRYTLEQRIAQAGLTITRARFFLYAAIVGPVLGFVTFLLSQNPLAGLAAIVLGSVGLPLWTLSHLRKRRLNKFVVEFPNAVDVIVRGIRAGLPLGDCLRIIATEAQEPVKSEFRMVCEQQQLGIPIGDACAEMYRRIPTQEANFFGIVIQIQQKSGGNLSEVLSNLSRVLRDRKKMKGKIQAMSMEAKASAGIIGALPFTVGILVYLTSPGYISLLWTTSSGKIAMVLGLIWMGMGIMVMKKMINFDF
jgi:tight adherence protein B